MIGYVRILELDNSRFVGLSLIVSDIGIGIINVINNE